MGLLCLSGEESARLSSKLKTQMGNTHSKKDLEQATDRNAVRVRQLLIETRVRLVTGLKRYLHTKHGEGLLSAASVQVHPPASGATVGFMGAAHPKIVENIQSTPVTNWESLTGSMDCCVYDASSGHGCSAPEHVELLIRIRKEGMRKPAKKN